MACSPIVSIQQGRVRGKVCTDFFGGSYMSFQGIPYAKPPIGKLRFKAPKPADPWVGILDCTKEGSDPISKDLFTNKDVGSEDCLFLNVYTTELSNLKPVMMYIYGGAFLMGSSHSDSHGPDFLMQKDVVLVTFNYRLGLFGFLSLEDKSLDIPGNAGIKDMLLALQWIQQNISHFGGDPNNVTVFGVSVGAVAIHYLMLSSVAKGLFHKAIMQSGCALGTRGQGQCSAPLINKAWDLIEFSDKEILDELQNMSSEEIFELQQGIIDTYYPNKRRPFGIVQEPYVTEHTVISENPLWISKSGNYNAVPLIIGYTSREGYLVQFLYGEKKVNKNFQKQIPFTYNLPKTSELSNILANEIEDFYFGLEDAALENSDNFLLLTGDNLFVRPIYNSAMYHAKASSAPPVYLYRLSMDTNLNYFKNKFNLKGTGTSHGDELGYLFTHKETPKISQNSIEANCVEMLTTLWTNFAKYGNPNSHNKDVVAKYWKPIQENQVHFADIGENFTTGINPEHSRMMFWERLEKKVPVHQ